MGKNGDQIQRLVLHSPAEVFFVQYWNRISQSVLEQLEALAKVRSLGTRATVYYGIMDGQDSNRLYRAYPSAFSG